MIRAIQVVGAFFGIGITAFASVITIVFAVPFYHLFTILGIIKPDNQPKRHPSDGW